jgi:COP9 signalosome complex subunit 5
MESSQRRWEMENQVLEENVIYGSNEAERERLDAEEPWKRDPHYFKTTKISAVACIKMVMHAKSGGNLEVMGLLQGKYVAGEIIVMDSFALPVEGTETRVNASATANEYMVNYIMSAEAVGRSEGIVGWYHSHPGYSCWLSGIDVSTQMLHQKGEDPYLAIVVDPVQTISSGKVDLKCFRTYPENYVAPDADPSEYQTIPLDKIEDFGVHHKAYYTLPHSFYKSALDSQILNQLWHKYWVQTLSANPLLASRDYSAASMSDLASKLDIAQVSQSRLRYMSVEKKESQLALLAKDASKIGTEMGASLSTLLLQSLLFNRSS